MCYCIIVQFDDPIHQGLQGQEYCLFRSELQAGDSLEALHAQVLLRCVMLCCAVLD